ncbi:MAG: hypothetical protein WBM04_16415 [Candidatus Korobacteraceae bacterium]
MQLATYELKYCERCGSLKLRRATSADAYCEPCGRILINYSLPSHAERARMLLRKPPAKSGIAPAMIDEMQVELPLGRLQ